MTEPVFLVTGEDESLLSIATNKVVRPFKEKDPLSVEIVPEHGELIAALRNVSLFSPLQVVQYDAKVLTESLTKAIVEYLRDPEPSTVLVLALTKTPKFKEKDPVTNVETSYDLLAEVKKVGGVHVKTMGRNSQETGRSLLEDSPVALDGRARQVLLEHSGENVSRIPSILEALQAAYGDVRIDVEMLLPFLGDAGKVPMWDLTDAIDKGDARKALVVLERILRSSPPIAVGSVLNKHIDWMFKLSLAGIRDEKEGAELLGLKKGASTYPVKKAISAARTYGSSLPALLELTSKAADDLRGTEGGNGLPHHLVVEILTARLASYPRR